MNIFTSARSSGKTGFFLKAFVLLAFLAAGAASSVSMAQDYKPGRLLVRVADAAYIPSLRTGAPGEYLTVPDPAVNAVFAGHRVHAFRQAFPDSRREQLLNVYELSCDCDAAALMYDLRRVAARRYTDMEQAPEATPLFTPDDYSLNGTHYALDLINAQQAWDVTRGNSEIKIAIIDGGCSYTDDLKDQIVFAYPDAATVSTGYIVAHGTFVAGCAAAHTDNGLGISGAGFNSKLMIYQGFDYNFILHATYNGARVVNMSWMNGCSPVTFYQEVINEAFENGTVLVASAGNGTTGGHCNDSQGMPFGYVYPASYNHVISVSGVGPYDNHDKFIGDTTKVLTHNDKVDICAPGYDVLGVLPGNNYANSGGTSIAAPIVSGVCALILAVNPSLLPYEVEDIIKQTAAVIDTLSYNQRYLGKLGAGRIDAGRACRLAKTYGKPLPEVKTYNAGSNAYAEPVTLAREKNFNGCAERTPYEIMQAGAITGMSEGNGAVITVGYSKDGERFLLIRLAPGSGLCHAESYPADGRKVATHTLNEGDNLILPGSNHALPRGLYIIRIFMEGGETVAGKYML